MPIPEHESNLVPEFAEDGIETLSKFAASSVPSLEKVRRLERPVKNPFRSVSTRVRLFESVTYRASSDASVRAFDGMIKPKTFRERFRNAFNILGSGKDLWYLFKT